MVGFHVSYKGSAKLVVGDLKVQCKQTFKTLIKKLTLIGERSSHCRATAFKIVTGLYLKQPLFLNWRTTFAVCSIIALNPTSLSQKPVYNQRI